MMDDIKTPKKGTNPPVSPEDDPLYVSEFSRQLEIERAAKETALKPKKKFRLGKLWGFKHWKQLNQKQRYVSLVAMGVLLSAGTAGAMELFMQDPPPPEPVNIIVKPKPEPTTGPSPLTGVEVDLALTKLPVTAVMIENSPDARPQSGLRDAGVVFEAIAEGGITRFLTLFQESQPGYIGPVRSVRPYYLDFLVPFDAPVAHAGGSAVALAQIRQQKIKDLDQSFNPTYYQRVSSRYAPHNLYTSREQLLKLHKAKGWNSSQFEGFARNKKAEPAEKPSVTSIAFNISSFNYNSVFKYDSKSNSYPRTMAGKPHIDEKSGKQIAPPVVIALIADHSYAGIYSVYKNHGKGQAIIFQNGTAVKATWTKKDRKSQLHFVDAAGKDIKLNPGQTWITLADNAGQVKY